MRSLGFDAAGNTLSDSNAGSGYTAVYNHEDRLPKQPTARDRTAADGSFWASNSTKWETAAAAEPPVVVATAVQG